MVRLNTASVLIKSDGTPDKDLFRDIYQAQEASKFLERMEFEEVAPGFDFGVDGYKPHPDDPDGDPWPGPFPGPGPWPYAELELADPSLFERFASDPTPTPMIDDAGAFDFGI